MPVDVMDLRQERAEKIKQARAILDNPKGENGELTNEQDQAYEALVAEAARMEARIKREEQQAQLESDLEEPLNTPTAPPDPKAYPTAKKTEWDGIGEWVHAILHNRRDPRLQYRESMQDDPRNDLQMGEGTKGGFVVPTQFLPMIQAESAQEAIVRPRATVIPAGSPPDSAVEIPALDQQGTKGVFSGMQVHWTAEGGAKQETEPSFRAIKLEPQEVAAHTVITDKLLRNAPALGGMLTGLLSSVIRATEDTDFLVDGTGVGRPRALIGHPATYEQSRATGSQINYTDIVNMLSRVKMGGQLVWIANQSALPQLMTMEDTEGHLIWQPSAREGEPDTLVGRPLLWNERSPQVGSKGDLILADLSWYWIKDGSPLAIAFSEHVHFVNNKTVVKAFWNVDGQPSINQTLRQENGYEVSPFVVLDA